ncbi:MAG: AMP-binding protein [Deltaproteobacteria bacterium]|nr:AMP-binding protein [Deltaproteobacteria bacterium]
MNLAKLLTESASRRPDHPAVISGGDQVTYFELNRRSDALAWGFKARGLDPGDIAVLMMPNSIDWITAYYALAKLGAVVLPVNFLYRTEELKHIFQDSGARAFIGDPDYLEYAGPLVMASTRFQLTLTSGKRRPRGLKP